ncbi:MAG: hypothetical protein MUC43_15135 [Pirellula sp.]|jgi:hypothetical protein|nr:hypothetical protein [Pirellula sp.]
MPYQHETRTLRFSTILLAWIAFTGISALGFGQQEANSSPQSSGIGQISVQETFAPSFQIEPLSHRLTGRMGDAIPFTFDLNAEFNGEIEVMPMGLKQELSGQILHDLGAKAADDVTLLTPSKMQLSANKAATIEGVVRLPKSDAKHHSIGILVRDLGRDPGLTTKRAADGSIATQAAVKFMTQYVLRIDLDVESARGEGGQQLRLEPPRLISQDGRPRFQMVLVNPTDSTFEFEARARIRSSPSDRSNKPLRLTLPIRSDIEDESRYVCRILPQSKVRLEEFLPEAIASGSYEVDVEILVGEKAVVKKEFPLPVDARDFPAQEVLIAQVGEDLQVSPAQIELSQIRGGNRRVTVLLKNNGTSNKTVKVAPKSASGLDLGEISAQPGEVSLAPGASRKISLTLKGQPQSADSVRFGFLNIESTTGKSPDVESKKLPLAMVLKKMPPAELEVAPLVWDGSGERVGFRTKISHSSIGHIPIDARLSILSESGYRAVVLSGFGKWAMPNTAFPIFFPIENQLRPGEYTLRCEVKTPDGPPKTYDQKITVTDLDNAKIQK